MKSMLFEYPKSAAFCRVLPKSKIFEHASPGTNIKRLFARQVKHIIWEYKLAPETINVAKTRSAPEIQIFSIELKEGELEHEVLNCIDQAISFPLIFEIHSEGQIKVAAAYKRPSESGNANWIISNYFETPWLPEASTRKPLPMALNLEQLYAHLLNPLMPFSGLPGEKLQQSVERTERILITQKALEKCNAALHKENQFNRKVAINVNLRKLKQELEILTRPTAGNYP